MIQTDACFYLYPGETSPLTLPALSISKGQRVLLIGPSGSGKTTLLHLLSGILEARQKTDVNGYRLDKMKDAERRAFRIGQLGLVFQDFRLLEYLNVSENILLPLRIESTSGSGSIKSHRARLERLAESLKISHKLKSNVNELSQGEKQRVSLCRCLIADPAVILADEPTGSLDPETKRLAIEQLFQYSGLGKATLIMATHDHSLVDRFDQVVELGDSNPAAKS